MAGTVMALDPIVAAALKAIQDAKVVPAARVESFARTAKLHLSDGRTLKLKLVSAEKAA